MKKGVILAARPMTLTVSVPGGEGGKYMFYEAIAWIGHIGIRFCKKG